MSNHEISYHEGKLPDGFFCIEDTPQRVSEDGKPISGDLMIYDEVRMVSTEIGEKAFFLLTTEGTSGVGNVIQNIDRVLNFHDIVSNRPRLIQGPKGILYVLTSGIVIDGKNAPFRCFGIDGQAKILKDATEITSTIIGDCFYGVFFDGEEFIFDKNKEPIQVTDGRYIKSLTYIDFQDKYLGVKLSDDSSAYVDSELVVLLKDGEQVSSIDRASGSQHV